MRWMNGWQAERMTALTGRHLQHKHKHTQARTYTCIRAAFIDADQFNRLRDLTYEWPTTNTHSWAPTQAWRR